MKRIQRIATLGSTAILLVSGWYGLAYAGIDMGRTVTNARCEAGAFMTHSTKIGGKDDSSSNDQASATDNFDPAPSAKLVGANLIANPGLETLVTNLPKSWQASTYGNNTSVFSKVAGHSSASAVRIDVSDYRDGSSSWYYNPIKVTAGSYYVYSEAYRSNAPTRPILAVTYADGTVKYVNLMNAPISGEWARYNISFFVPTGAVSVSVYHALTTNGWLETDDYALTQAIAQGFNQARVSITFDDGWKSIHDNALPVLQDHGFVSTQYLISGYLGQAKSYMSVADVYDLRAAGSEIASHTVDHLDLTKQSAKDATYQLTRSQQDLQKCFGQSTDFAAPYGTYNQSTLTTTSEHYQTARSTDVGYNSADSLNPYHLKVQNVDAETTPAQMRDWLQTAKANNLWLILVYHQVDADGSQYARSTQQFAADMQAIDNSKVAVQTVDQAYTQISQKAR